MFIGFMSMSTVAFAIGENLVTEPVKVSYGVDLNTNADDQGDMKVLITHSDTRCIKGAEPVKNSYVVSSTTVTLNKGGGTFCDPLGSVAVDAF